MRIFKLFHKSTVCICIILLIALCFCNGCSHSNKSVEANVSQTTIESDSFDVTGGIESKDINLSIDCLSDDCKLQEYGTDECYVNEEGTQYLFNKESGAYQGFVKAYVYKGVKKTQKYNKTELRQIADYAASCMVDISEYTDVTYFLQEDTGVHKFTYTKMLSGLPTADFGRVFITQDGVVEFLVFKSVGKYDGLGIPDVDIDKTDEKLNASVISIGDESIDSYNICSRVLDFEDNQWVVIYGCECMHHDGTGSFEYIKVTVD